MIWQTFRKQVQSSNTSKNKDQTEKCDLKKQRIILLEQLYQETEFKIAKRFEFQQKFNHRLNFSYGSQDP